MRKRGDFLLQEWKHLQYSKELQGPFFLEDTGLLLQYLSPRLSLNEHNRETCKVSEWEGQLAHSPPELLFVTG